MIADIPCNLRPENLQSNTSEAYDHASLFNIHITITILENIHSLFKTWHFRTALCFRLKVEPDHLDSGREIISLYCAYLSTSHLKTERQSSLRNVVSITLIFLYHHHTPVDISLWFRDIEIVKYSFCYCSVPVSFSRFLFNAFGVYSVYYQQ